TSSGGASSSSSTGGTSDSSAGSGSNNSGSNNTAAPRNQGAGGNALRAGNIGGVTTNPNVGIGVGSSVIGTGLGAGTGIGFGGAGSGEVGNAVGLRGTKTGRGTFRFSVAVHEGYDDNLFQTQTDTTKSFYTNVGGGISYNFGSPRLQLSALLNGGATYYYTRPGNKMDYTGALLFNALYKATSRLLITFNSQTAYLSQPDVSAPGLDSTQNGAYVFSNSTLSATYQWTRKFSTVTSYNFISIYYLDQGLNQSQGYISQTIGQQFRWLLLPKTNIVAEYRVNPVTYYGVDMDSLGQFFLLGFDQIFNARTTWNFRVGAEQRWNQNPVDGSSTYFGPYGESILNYQVGAKTALSWSLRYGTEPSGLADVTQRQTFRTGLSVSHQFTGHVSANLAVSYLNNYYTQAGVTPNFSENIVQAVIGLQYRINRLWALDVGYQYSTTISDQSSREFTRNVVFAGTSLNF
ncbi:MAG: outer membrane beta-barrel protein, partial [Chthoniobacterales bacterium]